MSERQMHAHIDRPSECVAWEPLTEEAYRDAAGHGRRWAYYGSADLKVRIQRWTKSGVMVRFADGHTQLVHPDDLHLAEAVPA